MVRGESAERCIVRLAACCGTRSALFFWAVHLFYCFWSCLFVGCCLPACHPSGFHDQDLVEVDDGVEAVSDGDDSEVCQGSHQQQEEVKEE